jgi:hypothetical protein
LERAQLIDSKLASGRVNGYEFRVIVSGRDYSATATPESYGSTGNRSFFISSDGVLRAANKHGLDATQSDEPYSNATSADDAPSSIMPADYSAPNEGSAQASLRTLHAAEATYQATAGQGLYGSMGQLADQNLVDRELASGVKDGYVFKVRTGVAQRGGGGAKFEITATPKSEYSLAGGSARAFFISEDGVIRVASEPGVEATQRDSPLDR